MDSTDCSIPGMTYIEQLQKVQLLTILLREKVANPSYMEPILARWYQLEKNLQEKAWRYDFLEHEVDGEATGFLMGKDIHPVTGLNRVNIYAYGGAAERWHRAGGGLAASYYLLAGLPQRGLAHLGITIPAAVWARTEVLF